MSCLPGAIQIQVPEIAPGALMGVNRKGAL